MEHLLEDKDIMSAELRRAWEEKRRQRDKATTRRLRRTVGLTIGILLMASSFYVFIVR